MISIRIINSNGGAMEYACANTGGIEVTDILEPSKKNVETLRANFPNLPVRHCYIGTELASTMPQTDVFYINVAKKQYTALESAVPIIDKNKAGSGGNGVLVMKNAFRLVGLQEPEMFIVETGLHIHTAASEAFAALPDYYIQQVIVRDARKCGYPMKKKKSFLIGTKRDFRIRWRERKTENLSAFLEKDVDCRELPAYAVNRMNGTTRSFPTVLIDPRTDSCIPNITGHYAKDNSTILVRDDGTNKFRSFTVKEISRFYGFPDDYTFIGSKREQIRQITDSIGTGFASFIVEDIIKTYFN